VIAGIADDRDQDREDAIETIAHETAGTDAPEREVVHFPSPLVPFRRIDPFPAPTFPA